MTTETPAGTATDKHTKIATWNVNSIRARLDRLLAWLDTRRPDVVCLQETKVADDDFPIAELRQAGYAAEIFGQRTYNGVAILTRTPPAGVVRGLDDLVRGFGDSADDPQCRFMVATVVTNGEPLRVASVYVPNGGAVGTDKFAYKLEWLRRWSSWLEATAASGPPLLLCGDFNIAPEDRDVCDPVAWAGQVLCHPDERAALAAIRACAPGFDDLFRRLNPDLNAFSWWDYRQLAFPRNQGLRIDHIYGSPPLAARCRGVIIDRETRKGKLPSDHAPVIAEFAL
jgi:exodeoxyribonuclease-3